MVRAASLPGHAGQHGADGIDHEPADAVFGGRDVQADDLAVAVADFRAGLAERQHTYVVGVQPHDAHPDARPGPAPAAGRCLGTGSRR
ncbi:hypothetical protein AQJ11_43310 [Streptomyces corchorusii]|uniref:Uncharacterized protein n=1 Tax=Streptomyces corchorusii TaxID=1903 RepID=A0A101PPM7_STRCK|nr:hypothetical protein AQJ11_43310 [Streptomyces corchorusii]